MGETGQLLHLRINGQHFNITHGKTGGSPVVEYFNGEGHTLADVTVMVIDKLHSHNSCLCKIWESRWIRPWGPHILWENEPQGVLPVKPA